jgi:hypothetical protein
MHTHYGQSIIAEGTELQKHNERSSTPKHWHAKTLHDAMLCIACSAEERIWGQQSLYSLARQPYFIKPLPVPPNPRLGPKMLQACHQVEQAPSHV